MKILKYLSSVVVVWWGVALAMVAFVALAIFAPIFILFSSKIDKSKWPFELGWYKGEIHE